MPPCAFLLFPSVLEGSSYHEDDSNNAAKQGKGRKRQAWYTTIWYGIECFHAAKQKAKQHKAYSQDLNSH